MPTKAMNENLFQQQSPWPACVALEDFFSAGGRCEVCDATNWIGIASTCEMKAEDDFESHQQLHHALAWAHLAVAIRESMATSYPSEEAQGIMAGAMWVRVKMIIRCGHHPRDYLCDRDQVVKWCLGSPQVECFLKMKDVPPFASLEPEVRSVADILATLVAANRLELSGVAADFLAAIRRARAKIENKA